MGSCLFFRNFQSSGKPIFRQNYRVEQTKGRLVARKFCLVAPGWCLAKQDPFSAQACICTSQAAVTNMGPFFIVNVYLLPSRTVSVVVTDLSGSCQHACTIYRARGVTLWFSRGPLLLLLLPLPRPRPPRIALIDVFVR